MTNTAPTPERRKLANAIKPRKMAPIPPELPLMAELRCETALCTTLAHLVPA